MLPHWQSESQDTRLKLAGSWYMSQPKLKVAFDVITYPGKPWGVFCDKVRSLKALDKASLQQVR